MNIIVYGVDHWPDLPPTEKKINHCKEWYDRIIKFIPYVSKVIIATGNNCNIEYSPYPKEVTIIQNNIPQTVEYSREYSYFRNGFMTGIWHTLLNEKNYNILFHIQARVLIGENLKKEIDDFMLKDNKLIMAPFYTQHIGSSIEISIFAMKINAIRKYATSGIRQSFNIYNAPDVNCEEEAYIMFHDSWYNPWPDILTTRQIDTFDPRNYTKEFTTPFCISNKEAFNRLPFISTYKKHVVDSYLKSWKECHPC